VSRQPTSTSSWPHGPLIVSRRRVAGVAGRQRASGLALRRLRPYAHRDQRLVLLQLQVALPEIRLSDPGLPQLVMVTDPEPSGRTVSVTLP
jgi:hypothetical protein